MKRQRLSSRLADDDLVLPEDYLSQQSVEDVRQTELDGAEKHQPGAIVRVHLTGFVTYTSVEFRPGPSLNMVIGPNGTGKSTLVMAINLGLGWDTAVTTTSSFLCLVR